MHRPPSAAPPLLPCAKDGSRATAQPQAVQGDLDRSRSRILHGMDAIRDRVGRWRHSTPRIAPDSLWRLAKGPEESAAHPLPIGKARLARDDIHRMPALLHHHPRRLDAEMLDSLRRRLPGLAAERAAELARAEIGHVGQLFYRKGSLQMAPGVGQRVLDAIGFRLELQQGGELRLAARPTMVEHQL